MSVRTSAVVFPQKEQPITALAFCAAYPSARTARDCACRVVPGTAVRTSNRPARGRSHRGPSVERRGHPAEAHAGSSLRAPLPPPARTRSRVHPKRAPVRASHHPHQTFLEKPRHSPTAIHGEPGESVWPAVAEGVGLRLAADFGHVRPCGGEQLFDDFFHGLLKHVSPLAARPAWGRASSHAHRITALTDMRRCPASNSTSNQSGSGRYTQMRSRFGGPFCSIGLKGRPLYARASGKPCFVRRWPLTVRPM